MNGYRAILGAGLLLVGCVVGFRGEAVFEGDHDLSTVDAVRLALPSTPVLVAACRADMPSLCPQRLSYGGRWRSVGGTEDDAAAHARAPLLVFEQVGDFAELRAEIPLEVRGLVDLQMDEIVLPDDRDLEIRTGTGDVEVFGMRGAVVVDVDVGEVEVSGAEEGVAVRVDLGSIRVVTGGHVDLRTGSGDVEVIHTAGARDTFVRSGAGDVHLELGDDLDVDLHIRAPGTIRVRTPAITTITTGHFDRRTGTGMVRIELVTEAGDVLVEPAE